MLKKEKRPRKRRETENLVKTSGGRKVESSAGPVVHAAVRSGLQTARAAAVLPAICGKNST